MEPKTPQRQKGIRSMDGMGPGPKRSGATLDLRQAKSEPEEQEVLTPQNENGLNEDQLFDYPDREPARPAASKPRMQGRFWRSFWRFVLILFVLGLLISAGIYVYLNYFHQS